MIKCQKFTQSNCEDWERFISSSSNGTIFHYRKFIDYHENPPFQDSSLLFYKKNHLIAVLPAAIKDNQFISHPGISFGSFIYNTQLSYSDTLNIINAFKNYLDQKKYKKVIITLPPDCYSKSISHYIEFCLYQLSFKYLRLELSNVVNINKKIDEVMGDFKTENRTAIRKAKKANLIIQQSEKYDDFYSILKKNLKLRHNVIPTHTIKEIKKIKELFPNEINLFTAEHNNNVIAGVINFVCNQQTVLAFYISHNTEFQNLRPLNLLFVEIFEWAISNKYQYYDFGLFTDYEKPNISLARFKESFGSEGVFRKTMILE
tara:strand:- start:584 stop:1534 length:951 start_codon:yes stop_codon:yes gene_type:complete